MSNKVKAIAKNLVSQIVILSTLVSLLWIIEAIDWLHPLPLDIYGIIPRTEIGLRGIFLAPFLHGNFAHLSANTAPLIVFGWLILLAGVGDFLFVSAVAMLTSGAGTWLIGAPGSVHIGASGVIFGYFGFLLLRGLFDRSPMSIILSLIIGFLYGGFIWGVLPNQPGISWEGHLFGFLGGVLAARILGNRRRQSLP
ncbi:MAG: rhomboid family intramembrane serine protease [Okeania sp. SIO2H7]|nr:rhomboid family intramembrane serine protease [Okeania sp. SIO2H7]